jgi:hypothetical protein
MIIFGGPVETTTTARVERSKRSLQFAPVVGVNGAGLFASGTF